MKSILATLSAAFLLSANSDAAVTFSVANYSGSTFGPNGIPVVDVNGVAVPINTVYASIGYFTSLPTGVVTAETLLSTFVAVDTTGVANASYAGLFNGQDYSSPGNVYPTGFQGKTAYLVIGNAQNVVTSTAVAAFTLNTLFPAPNPDTTASFSIVIGSANTSALKFGALRSVTTQPRIDTNPANDYQNGVQLLSSGSVVPEPSAALLGAFGVLGLLRRRRN